MRGIVLVPSFRATAPAIVRMAASLKGCGLACTVAPDLRAAAREPLGKRWVCATRGVRDAVLAQPQPPVVLAYSLGALPATRVAATMPARVHHLVLVGPVVEITGRTEQARQHRPHLVEELEPLEQDAEAARAADGQFLEGQPLRARLAACTILQGDRDDTSPPWTGPGTRVELQDDHFYGSSVERIAALVRELAA